MVSGIARLGALKDLANDNLILRVGKSENQDR